MPKAVEPDKVPINSPADLRHEVDALLAVLQLNETEDTWEKINKALKRFQAVVRGGACRFTDEFVAAMRDPRMAKGVCRSLTTERGALSGTALEMVASCTRLGTHFAPLLAVYFPTVLRLFARPNKVYVTRAASTAASIIRNTRLGEVLRFIVLEWRNEGGKSASFREQAAAAVAVMLGCDTGSLAVEKDSLERRIEDLEWIIKTGAVGREATVRAEMKKCWDVYRREWPDRVASFTAPMTPTIRKYLKVDQMQVAASSTSNAHPAPPRKPNPPPPSTAAHALPTGSVPSRPTSSLLSKSHGPPASHAPARHPLAASASTRPLPTASSSTAAPIAPPLASLPASSLGTGAPPHRAARVDQPRSVSASASTSSSRSASRNDERDNQLSASTSSLQSSTMPSSSSAHATRTGFKPTAPSKTGPIASRATRALAASTTASANSASTMAPPHEPRKARRVVPAAPAVPPPTSSAVPTPAPAATTLASSQTSSTMPTPSTATRSRPPPGSSAASVPAPPGSSHAPFRPKLTSSTVAAAALGAMAAVKTRPAGTTARSAPPAPVHPDSQKDKENDKPRATAPSAPSRPAAATAPAPSTAPAVSTRTRPPRARSPDVARPKAVPSAATLASRERRAARERERERKAAEEAAAEEMRRRGEKEREEERVRREEGRMRAADVPLPVDEEGEEDGLEPKATDVEEEAEAEEAEADLAVVIEGEESREEMPLGQQEDAPEVAATIAEPVMAETDAEPVTVEVDIVEPLDDEVGMDSDMVVESLPASQVTPVEDKAAVAHVAASHSTELAQAVDADAQSVAEEAAGEAAIAVEADAAQDLHMRTAQQPFELDDVSETTAQHVGPVEDVGARAHDSEDALEALVVVQDDEVCDAQLAEVTASDEVQEGEPATTQRDTVDKPLPAYDDLPPSPLLAAVAEPHGLDVEAVEADPRAPDEHDFQAIKSATPSATPALYTVPRDNSSRPSPLHVASPSPRDAFELPPVSTPPAATRDDTPFTPALRAPPVRFPASTLAFSPEPFQTCSIILDTPPKLDDPPMAVHLPGRVFSTSEPAQPDMPSSELPIEESDEEENDESILASPSPASPLTRKSASPLAPASQPQPVFFPDDGDMSGYDADTTFGDEIDGEPEVDDIDSTVSPADEESFAETGGERSREFVVPLNDTSAYDHFVHGDEVESADSSANEKDESLASDKTVHVDSPARGVDRGAPVDEIAVKVQQAEEVEAEEDDEEEEDEAQDVLPASPAGTTLDFSDLGVAVSSTPLAVSRRALWDESLLGDESANFELEQSKLCFHDETESEHDVSGASTVLGDLHISSPALPPRTARVFEESLGDERAVLKRSLRSRVVTVDLQTSTSKTPARVTRAMAATGRDVLGEMQA